MFSDKEKENVGHVTGFWPFFKEGHARQYWINVVGSVMRNQIPRFTNQVASYIFEALPLGPSSVYVIASDALRGVIFVN